MISVRHLRSIVALTALGAATPALASDFDEVIYLFVALAVVAVAVFVGFVFALRSLAKSGGPLVDALSAIVLAAAFAPSTFVGSFDTNSFTLYPTWMLLAAEKDWTLLFPAPALSLVLTTILLYLLFKSRRTKGISDAPEELA